MHTGCLISDETLCTSFSAYTNLLRTRINHNLRWIYKVKGFWNVQLTTLADYTTLVLTVWRKFCLLLWSQFLCCSQFRVPAQLVFRDVWKQLHQASYAMKYHAQNLVRNWLAKSFHVFKLFQACWVNFLSYTGWVAPSPLPGITLLTDACLLMKESSSALVSWKFPLLCGSCSKY